MDVQQTYDFAVIGGGVYGLSIAYHLSKTEKTVALFERFTIGHHNGSSHGPSRIARSTYALPVYRDLNTLALNKYWPQMQHVLDSKLVFRNECITYEQRKQEFKKYEQTVKSAKTKFKFLTPEQVCEQYPSMPYIQCSNPCIVDEEAAMIAADDYVYRLGEYLKKAKNVAVFENTEISKILKNKECVSISTDREIVNANKVVVAAGRWLLELYPELSDIFHIAKQHIAYLKLENPEQYQFGRIPSFIYNGHNTQFYSTPDRKELGLKIGTHSMIKNPKHELEVAKQAKENHQRVGKQLFKQKFKGVNKYDECYYTVTSSEGFVIDWIDPEEQKILICSCCSGHGFKFSPAIGKIISDVMQEGKSLQLFEENRYMFQIPYHRGMNLN